MLCGSLFNGNKEFLKICEILKYLSLFISSHMGNIKPCMHNLSLFQRIDTIPLLIYTLLQILTSSASLKSNIYVLYSVRHQALFGFLLSKWSLKIDSGNYMGKSLGSPHLIVFDIIWFNNKRTNWQKCNNLNGSQGHYAESKVNLLRSHTLWFYLYNTCNDKIIEVDDRLVNSGG